MLKKEDPQITAKKINKEISKVLASLIVMQLKLVLMY
tara:strand:- start:942 stop:1052 length:111 start_codon:yes stop_codon:yes gene_type:complete